MLPAAMVCVILLASAGYGAPAESTSASPLANKDPGAGETAIGSLVADAFRAAMRTDIALVSAGDLKPSDTVLPAGNVQSGDVTSLLAYPDDHLVVLALDGRMIREALERSVARYPRSGLSFLQVSGLRFVFDPARDVRDRVISVSVGDTPIVKDKAYTVATVNSLANGALGYWKVWSKRNIVSKSDKMSSTAAVEKLLAANPKIDYSTLNRVTVAK